MNSHLLEVWKKKYQAGLKREKDFIEWLKQPKGSGTIKVRKPTWNGLNNDGDSSNP